MIEVLKEGNSSKTIKCPHCEALLRYRGIDVREDYKNLKERIVDVYITCPDCGKKIILDTKTLPESNTPNLIGITH